jgi:negative regulator of flagellin synthesis FlgM
MAININNLPNNNQIKQKLEQQVQVKQQATQNSVGSEQVKSTGKDSVSLTPQAQQLNELRKKANEAPAVDQNKMEKLKKAIADGEYKVNPEKLAASIANFEFKLG